MSLSINPMQTTNALGGFSISSTGYVQGEAIDEPAVRFQLAGGVIASSETLPMWGAIALYENLPTDANYVLGSTVGRALTNAAVAGFSVFNQAHAWINTPQSPVPTGQVGQTTNFYRFGSLAKIPVAIEAALAATLLTGATNVQVSWDFTNQKLIAYSAGIGALPCKIIGLNIGNSKTVSYSGGNTTWNNSGSVALIQI